MSVSLLATLALCGSAFADSVTGPLTSTVSQVSSSVAPTHTVTQIVTDTVAAAATPPSATPVQPSTTPAQSTPEQPSAPATTGVLSRVVREVTKPMPATHATSSIAQVLAASGDHTRRAVSHTLTRGVGGLERVVTQTASSTLARASSPVGGIVRRAPHVLGSALAEHTSQIVPEPTKDASPPTALLPTPATGAQLTPSPPVDGMTPAADSPTVAHAGVSSFVLGSRRHASLSDEPSPSLNLPESLGSAASAGRHTHGVQPPAAPPSPLAPGGGNSSAAFTGSATSGGLLLFTLIGLLALAGSWATYRLRILDDPLRPAPFVLIPQRPG